MARILRSVTPLGIPGQIVMLAVCVVLVFQVAVAAVIALRTELLMPGLAARLPQEIEMAHRFADYVSVLNHLPASARPQVLETMRAASPNLAIEWRAVSQTQDLRPSENLSMAQEAVVQRITRSVGPEIKLFVLAIAPGSSALPGLRHLNVAAVLRDASIVTGTVPALAGPPGAPARPLGLILFTLALIAIILVAFLWWAARALTVPLARFAEAAEGFSLDRDPEPLPEDRGPDEVRTASRALNRMQARVRQMMENRTRMLAAVSHDLRTPITRMRLRAEFIDQNDIRYQMLHDLDQMDRMVHGALAYLRDGTGATRRELIELASLLQTVCDDFADAGGEVRYDGPDRLLVRGNTDELQRAVANLVDNALKHGGTGPTVQLRTLSDEVIVIDVIDTGPGVPKELKEAMIEPFARGDAARSLSERPAGFGLGLAIARSVAEAHGGRFLLLDSEPTGLIARLKLPIRVDFRRP